MFNSLTLIFKITLLFSLSVGIANSAPSGTLVKTAVVTQGTLKNDQIFIGTVYFNQSSVLAARTQGLVLTVNFDTTQQVKKGDILVELDHEILDSKIKAIRASLKELKLQQERAGKDLKRYNRLLKQKSVSQQKFDEIYYAKIGLDQKLISLEAELDSLMIERGQSIIKAPFDGIISKRNVDVGEWVSEGGTIATLINPEHIDVLFNIPASYAINIQPASKIDVSIAENSYAGIIEGIIIDGDEKSRTFPLKISIQSRDQHLLAGMEARINLQTSTSPDTLLVPRDAVIKRFGKDVVFVNNNNTAQMIPVIVTQYKNSTAAVKAEDLKAGMHVVIKGNERIFPEQSLRTEPES
jgi:RND family efflux transporter MFP subunit